MKIILTSALALALTAFGARAQTSTNSDKNNPASSSSSKAEDKGAAGMPKDQSSSALPGTSSTTPLDTTTTAKDAKAAPADDSKAIAQDTTSAPADQVDKKKTRKAHRHPEAQGRSGSSSMHRKGALQDDSTGKTDNAGKADQPLPDNALPSAKPPVTAPATPDQPAAPPPDEKK